MRRFLLLALLVVGCGGGGHRPPAPPSSPPTPTPAPHDCTALRVLYLTDEDVDDAVHVAAADTSDAMARSGIPLHVVIAGIVHVPPIPRGTEWDWLQRPEVAGLRAQYDADLVQLVSHDLHDVCGWGGITSDEHNANYAWYSVIWSACLYLWPQEHAAPHEIAHNLGAAHEPGYDADEHPVRPYAYGSCEGGQRDIMADGCMDEQHRPSEVFSPGVVRALTEVACSETRWHEQIHGPRSASVGTPRPPRRVR